MPTECQTDGVGNDWKVTHEAYDGGTCQGFVTSTSAEAMGYFTKEDLPFSCGMASTFPIADRYFCSAMAQTDPNRRYLIAGTSLGLIDDTFPLGAAAQRGDLRAVQQARHHLEGLLLDPADPRGLPPADLATRRWSKGLAHIDQFYTDAAAGKLPAFSLVEPNYDEQSEENPQDIQFGDQFVGKVVNAVMSSPNWPKTMLIWTYDEHGGYYDHVPPPAAVTPDDVPPALVAGDPPGGFDRYGFRVPCARGEPLLQEELRVPHRLRPHVDPQDRRREVEPARADPARRQRQQPVRHGGPEEQAGLPEAAEASGGAQPGDQGRVPHHRTGDDSPADRRSPRPDRGRRPAWTARRQVRAMHRSRLARGGRWPPSVRRGVALGAIAIAEASTPRGRRPAPAGHRRRVPLRRRLDTTPLRSTGQSP